MLRLDAALVSADQPSLEEGGDEADARHDFVSRVGAATDHGDLMLVPGRRHSGITFPSMGVNRRPGFYGTLDEGKEAVRRDIPDALKADSAKPTAVLLGCHRDDRLVLGVPASLALFRAANIGFVNLDGTEKQMPTRPDHRTAQLVQPRPRRLIAAKPQFPLEPERTDPVLLAGDEPHRQKPHPQWLAGAFEDRPGRQRCLLAAGPAPQPPSRHHPWFPRHPAMRAGEPCRPSQTTDVVLAGFVVAEPLVKSLKRLRVIDSRHRMSDICHPPSISPGAGGMKGIPSLAIYPFVTAVTRV